MKETSKQVIVYIAEDGTEFLDKEKCKQYEDTLSRINKNFKVFHVNYGPDLTETGNLQYKMYAFVYSEHFYHHEILERWLVEEKKLPIIAESVQGYWYQSYFNIHKLDEYNIKDAVKIAKNNNIECVLLSPEKFQSELIQTFDFNNNDTQIFDYIKHWGFK